MLTAGSKNSPIILNMDQNNPYKLTTPPPYTGGVDSGALTRQVSNVMKRVYVRMFVGLLITAFVSLGIASTPTLAHAILTNQIVFWGILIAMFAMAWIMPAKMMSMKPTTILLLFGLFSVLMGAWLTPIFFVYAPGTIVKTFFISAGTFGAMSVYGYFTKSDLSRIGNYLYMALIGLFIAIIVNIFLKSSALGWIISIVGVLLFVGLTAWDTQQMKRVAAANLDPALADKLATMGALNLYLDFINLFLFLLQIFGGNRN